jgi:hypothetical protein
VAFFEGDPYRRPTYVELGAAFRDPPTTPQQRHLHALFRQCVLGAIAHYRDRLDAIEAELCRRDRELRRARFQVIEGGRKP